MERYPLRGEEVGEVMPYVAAGWEIRPVRLIRQEGKPFPEVG